jgi:hypothetical protein
MLANPGFCASDGSLVVVTDGARVCRGSRCMAPDYGTDPDDEASSIAELLAKRPTWRERSGQWEV